MLFWEVFFFGWYDRLQERDWDELVIQARPGPFERAATCFTRLGYCTSSDHNYY